MHGQAQAGAIVDTFKSLLQPRQTFVVDNVESVVDIESVAVVIVIVIVIVVDADGSVVELVVSALSSLPLSSAGQPPSVTSEPRNEPKIMELR